MKERIESMLKRVDIKFKEVLVLGSYIHMSFRSEAQAKRAAVLFPGRYYTIRMFERLVETPHGRSKYGKEWKVVAQVKT